MERPASYYFNTYEAQKITRHTEHGLQEGTLSLCEFFGAYFVIFTSYTDAEEIARIDGSHADADRNYRRFLKQYGVLATA